MRSPIAKRVLSLAVGSALLLGLTGCIGYYRPGYYDPYYGYDGPYDDCDGYDDCDDEADYLGYYDGYYGPFIGGYWADDGFFYYYSDRSRRYHRDELRHYRRHSFEGGKAFHGWSDGRGRWRGAPRVRGSERRHDRDRPHH